MKIVSGVIGALLLAVFIGPVVIKLNTAALWVVAGIGFTMTVVDIVQSLREKDEG